MTLRLTLRTLLAYLDDTLRTAQADEISQKIAESPVAGDLVERIKRVVGKPRRRSKVQPLDANDLAEYIDNELADARVAEFERQCLEFDSRLSEVAGVHQILTMYLGSEPNVLPGAAERIELLRLAREQDAAKTGPVTSVTAKLTMSDEAIGRLRIDQPSLPQEQVARSRRPHEVAAQDTAPLDSEKRVRPSEAAATDEHVPLEMHPYAASHGVDSRWIWGLAAVSLVVILSLAVWRPWSRDSSEPLQVAKAPANGEGAAANVATPAADLPKVANGPEPPGKAVEAAASKEKPIPREPEPDSPESLLRRAAAAVRAGIEPIMPTKSSEDAASSPKQAATPPKDPVGGEPVVRLDKAPAVKLALNTKAASPADAPKAKSTPIASAVPLATYGSDTGILFQRSAGELARLKTRAYVYGEDRLATPAGFRATLELANRASLELVGPAKILLSSERGIDLAFSFIEGKLALRTGPKPASFQVGAGAAALVIKLTTPNALVGLDLSVDAKGNADADARQSVSIYVIRGDVTVSRGPETRSLTGGHQLHVELGGEMAEPEPSDALVDWIAPRTGDPADERAATLLATQVPFESRVALALREALTDRSRQVRRMAVDSLAAADEYPELVNALGNTKHEDVRTAAADATRDLLTHQPQRAEEIRRSLLAYYNETDAQNIVALLLGFSPEALSATSTRENLVELLDSSQLAIRELAIHQLKEIAGRDMGYSADAPAARRATPLTQWRRWAKEPVRKAPAPPPGAPNE